jgi:hypothetical protein
LHGVLTQKKNKIWGGEKMQGLELPEMARNGGILDFFFF